MPGFLHQFRFGPGPASAFLDGPGPLSQDGAVHAVAVGKRGGQPVIVSGGWDGMVRVWDMDSGELVLGPLTGHDGPVTAMAAGEYGGQPVIVSGGEDGTMRVWDLDSELHANLRIEFQHRVQSIAAAANWLVLGTTAGLLRVDLLQQPERSR